MLDEIHRPHQNTGNRHPHQAKLGDQDRPQEHHSQDVDGQNRKHLVFSEFRRFDNDGNPVNPWGNTMHASTDSYYYVKFDIDHDNVIAADTGQPPGEDVRRSVIVWTHDPETDPGSETRLIKSW